MSGVVDLTEDGSGDDSGDKLRDELRSVEERLIVVRQKIAKLQVCECGRQLVEKVMSHTN
jgi:hypothetical protein